MNAFRFLVCFACTLLSAAAATGRDMAAESKIETALARIDPALVDGFREARIAIDKDDYASAARLLAPVVEKAPNFDPALRRYGVALANSGQRSEGLKWLEKAVALKRDAANLASLAQAMIGKDGSTVPDATGKQALALAMEATRLPDGKDFSTIGLAAQVSLSLRRYDESRKLVAEMEERFPNELGTRYFAAIVAAVDSKWIKAENEILAAQKLGLDAKTVNAFLDSGVHTQAQVWRVIRTVSWTVGLWIGGLLLLFIGGYVLSLLTLRQVDRADPNIAIAPAERRLRKIYRNVINVAGVYYYMSLPVIMVLIIAVSGSVIWGFLMIGWLPIKIAIILVIGALATIWSVGGSLFIKVESSDPGRALTREEAEPLWRLTEEVAGTLNTRPIDEIRVTPGTDLCVYERGTWREKLDNRAKRVLVLGTAVLHDFKLDHFRSVLAHEYGHFANRDTAGGDVALRVRNDMLKLYYTMVQAGQATWLNVAFHFLRLYHFLFQRVSHGATRLQEVLADRVAAQAYGPAAFEGGLRHVIRGSIHFDQHADREIKAALQANRPIHNLYEPVITDASASETAIAEAINRPTSADDTHPGPLDRFRLIAPIPEPAYARSETLVWSLFKDREALLKEMTAEVEKNIADHRSGTVDSAPAA